MELQFSTDSDNKKEKMKTLNEIGMIDDENNQKTEKWQDRLTNKIIKIIIKEGHCNHQIANEILVKNKGDIIKSVIELKYGIN
jgi:hypothetical protein